MEVRLPNDQRPVFPDRCVRCGVERPGAEVRVGTISSLWLSPSFWGLGPKIAAPACPACVRRLRRARWLRPALSLAIVAVGVVAGIVTMKLWPNQQFTALPGHDAGAVLILGAIALALLCHLLVWDFVLPAPNQYFFWHGVSNWPRRSTQMAYEFQDKKYAADFAALNQAQ